MNSTWKAKCVWVSEDNYTDWNIGDIIEIIDGVGVKSENNSHGFGGYKMSYLQSFEKWCEFQEERLSKWELIKQKITLREYINQMTNEDLAEMIVKEVMEDEGYYYITTDEELWYNRESAINHQIELLESEYNED